ncbi:hypothetical protein Q2V57_17500 [Enterobacter bugandensis]|uniref:hypothetical protein n=1 Tax=Enterobacter bugandensis TaxID=881260 RepID=UPI002665494D|nr:hypothetical protein [Enterobacter bugandensis]MDO2433354.1 hypothetical protein [Enterobacter bugandensis]MDO2446397.1 hypothetical protein [Enterobacter bugandensis]
MSKMVSLWCIIIMLIVAQITIQLAGLTLNFFKNNILISENTIRMVTEDVKEHVVGDNFSGKLVRLENDKVVPLRLISDNTFEVNCNKYINVNGYRGNGIPDYEELDPKGRKGIDLSYPAPVFSVSDIGI